MMQQQPLPPPGPVVAIGFFLVAALRLMFIITLVMTLSRFELLSTVYAFGMLAAGAVIAFGWARALRFPREALRIVGAIGLIGGLLFAMFGLVSVFAFGASRLIAIVEVGVCIVTLVGAYLWRNGTFGQLVLAALAVGAYFVTSMAPFDFDGNWSFIFTYGVIPATAWALTGVVALAIRPQRTADVPMARVINQ